MYHGFCNKFVHVCYLDLLLWVSSSFRDPQQWILQFFFLFLNCWDYFEWKFWCWKWHCLSSCGNLTLCSFFKSTVSFFRKSVLFWKAFFHFLLVLLLVVSQMTCFYLCFDCDGLSKLFSIVPIVISRFCLVNLRWRFVLFFLFNT